MTTNSELARFAAGSLVKRESSLTRATGKSLAVTGGVGLGLYVVAGLIPFISLPMILALLVLSGGFLYFKG